VRLNACKCIANLAHHPKAQIEFASLGAVALLEPMIDHDDWLLRRNVATAIELINHKP
jgi:hypothetical protein